jgi:outer membrane receptor protein involved in Fe transport
MDQLMISTSNEDELISLFEALIPINQNFYPERADQAVFGIETSISSHFNLTLQTYYKNIKNFIGYNLNRTAKADPDFSSGKGKSYGLEALIKFNYYPLFGWITYDFSKSEKTQNGITFPPRYDKRHNINVVLGTKLPYDIDFSINWEGSTGMPFSPIIGSYDVSTFSGVPLNVDYSGSTIKHLIYGLKNSERLPFYHKMDINMSKSFIFTGIPKINIALNIINIYDQKNIFYFDIKTGERTNMLPFLPSLSIGAEL